MATEEKDTYITSSGNVRPKRKPKTVKEKKYVKELIANGGNKVKAVKAVYNVKDTNSASTIAAENSQKLTFDDYFAKAGLTDEVIAGNITQAAYAFDPLYDVPDWQIRLKAHDLALKVMGKFAPVKSDITSDGEKITPIFGGISIVSSHNSDTQNLQSPPEN